MHRRQSTMFKPLKVFAILLAVIALAHGQDTSTGSTDMSTTDNDNISIFDGGLLEGILDILQNGPLGFIFKPLSFILRPIFFVLDIILAPLFSVLKAITRPLIWFLDVVLLPVHGITGLLGDVDGLLSNILSNVGSLISFLLSTISGLLSYVFNGISSSTEIQERSRRGIMDSLMGMLWNFPFHFVFDIISTIFSPLHLIYIIVTWPYHYFFGDSSNSDLSSACALSTDLSPLTDIVSSFLSSLSQSSQDAIIQVLTESWTTIKEYVLPALDNLFVSASSSPLVPTDVQSWLISAHTGYSMLHMLGIV